MPNRFGGTLTGGEFDWGGRLPKCNGGAQRFSQADRKPAEECKGIRELDCKTDRSSRLRKQALVIRWFHMDGPSLNG